MATNSTTYYNLPVFAATDHPKWLVDWNTSMEIIDGAIAQAKAAGDNAQTTANANAVAISGLNESVSTMSTALGTLTTNVTTLTGNVQRINELIGNGTPTTQDKTIIGAINELKAAIDALAPGGEVSAAEVSYDNTGSGLTSDDVQDAIDEVDAKIGFPTRLNQGAPQYSPDGGLTWANFNGALSIDEVESAESVVEAYTQTLSYTFLNDHNEILISANAVQYYMATGAPASAQNIDITCTSSDVTVNEYHDTHYTLRSGQNTNYIFGDRHTFHIENVKAGDVITFTATCDTTGATSVSSPEQVFEYTIFTVN